ncbi:Y-family DNA polymerase [Glacieibacterium sp.]|uniref:Y-family DNA polymerase n=1 Tax=Glacieibacterium sp. TaxID=2860237 RepID=UPI003B00AB34
MDESQPLRWLYFDLNSYFASVEQQLQPELRGRPIAVAAVHTDSTAAIAASYEAKAYGIKTGTPIWEAKAMCRDLVVVPARHQEYVRFHHAIIAEIETHVPVTAVCSIDEVACRLMNNENSRSAVEALAGRIKAGVAANVGVCLKSSIGVAPNRLLAKIASDMMKPDGLTILEAVTLHDRLCTLKPGDIPGVGRNMEKRLAAAGVVDMARILSLSAREARRVWGSVWGERLYWLLRGADLPEVATQRRSIGHSAVLSPERRTPDRARLVVRRLLMKAATRLRRMECRTSMLVLTVKGEDKTKWSHGQRLVAAQDSITMLGVLDGLWQRMLAEMPEHRYRQVSVALLELTPAAEAQLALFDSGSSIGAATEARRLALSRALDKANGRWGRDAVTIGHDASGATRSSGPKIAFTRIPELAEFSE